MLGEMEVAGVVVEGGGGPFDYNLFLLFKMAVQNGRIKILLKFI